MSMHLQEVDLDEVLDNDVGVVEVILQKNRAKTLQNARAVLAHGHSWSFSDFNSNHFVTHSITGKTQLDGLKSVCRKAFFSAITAELVIPESPIYMYVQFAEATSLDKVICGNWSPHQASLIMKKVVEEAKL